MEKFQHKPKEERESVSIFDTKLPEQEFGSETFGNLEDKSRQLAKEWLANPAFIRDINFLKYSNRAMGMLEQGLTNKIDVLKIEHRLESLDDLANNREAREELNAYTKKLTKALREEFQDEILKK